MTNKAILQTQMQWLKHYLTELYKITVFEWSIKRDITETFMKFLNRFLKSLSGV